MYVSVFQYVLLHFVKPKYVMIWLMIFDVVRIWKDGRNYAFAICESSDVVMEYLTWLKKHLTHIETEYVLLHFVKPKYVMIWLMMFDVLCIWKEVQFYSIERFLSNDET